MKSVWHACPVTASTECYSVISAEISNTPYCEIQLTEEKEKAFTYAVKNHYWYQMYLDDLPVWGKLFIL
jgi:hypothetical protein